MQSFFLICVIKAVDAFFNSLLIQKIYNTKDTSRSTKIRVVKKILKEGCLFYKIKVGFTRDTVEG